MRRDSDVPDPSPMVSEEHENEQEPVGRRRDHEEVGSHDLADVISQECAPGLRGRPVPTSHVFSHGRLRDVDPEFQQFAVNARCAPTGVSLLSGEEMTAQRAARCRSRGRFCVRSFHVVDFSMRRPARL
jgi:hypothetical protein